MVFMTNVQVSKYQDFQDKKILVVDDFPEFRTAIKRMVEAFGATNVDTSSNGEDAINLIKAKHYDAILCDYNLGEGKDGQQVLEEAKFKGIIKEDQIFILLTAENTAEMVMGALEYEPDGYLVKPFTKEMVHQRLTKTITKKAELADVYDAIHHNDLLKAIVLCDEKIAAGDKTMLNCIKIKSKLQMKLGKYDDAFKLFDEFLAAKTVSWVLMGRGQCNYYFKKYDKALADFEAIIALSAVNVEGYDWVAKTKLAMGDAVGAQEILENAARLSSKAILRQQLLGDIAYGNKNIEVAEKAYRWAVQLGKYSCYRRVLDYLNYAEVLILKSNSDEHGRTSLRAGNDAVLVLESLANLYGNDRVVQAQANIGLVAAYQTIKKNDKAKLAAKKALSWVEKDHIKLDKQWLVKLGEALILVDEQEKGQELINNNAAVADNGAQDAV